MKHILKLISGSALGLACLAISAQAELVLSGTTAGYFQGTTSGDTVITNTDGSYASFRTGVPVAGTVGKSGVEFNAASFSNIHSGDTFGFGLITYFNGRTQIGTSQDTAMLDFWLDLSDPNYAPFKLTTITFGIDPTVNDGSLVPDGFTASFTQPSVQHIGDRMVTFTIGNLDAWTEVAEDTWLRLADITVTFSPVPEPATYGLMASLGLMGVAAYRRFRGAKSSAPLAAA